MERFTIYAKNSKRHKDYRFWKDGNHTIDFNNNNIDVIQKINYIHNNPIKAGIVESPEHYVYSSARDYMLGTKGLVPVEII
ncbi:hypothetical protein QWY93_09340 [Echinicola jeungdonensis]|uniref:Transposase n=1 Tax=Echinicola jeungdonensis TaxID=709343 RepID=A0ABV5J6U7_9BACT|nr:hypothetical protein [Echinicola jeungdonensis]MDN3669535.1 hypothetical protein [Echinicola jeungdonensis]